MSEAGKRPSKPGQLVMIVGIPTFYANHVDNGIIATTVRRVSAQEREPECARCKNPGWELRDCSRPTLRSLSRYFPSAATKYSVVIADPDIDVSETESLGLPEGVLS